MKQANRNPAFGKLRSRSLLVLAASVAFTWMITADATEVYTWTDENGVVHYSDAPPMQGETQRVDVPEAYRPGTSDAYDAPAAPAAAPSVEGASAEAVDPPSAAELRREQIATQRKERREEQGQIDKLCELHRARLAQVEPARRVFYTNDAGESVRMDDDERLGLVDESKEFIEKNCE